MKTEKMVRFWLEPAELLVETVFALQDIQKRFPSMGWVPGDATVDPATIKELSDLREKFHELSAKQESPKEKLNRSLDVPITESVFHKVSLGTEGKLTISSFDRSVEPIKDSDGDIDKGLLHTLYDKTGLDAKSISAIFGAMVIEGLLSESSRYYRPTSKYRRVLHTMSALDILDG